MAVSEDMRRSAVYFRDHVWPLFKDHLGGGQLIPVESVTDSEFAKLLDMQAGIDGWQVVGTGGIRGIASRVQYMIGNWGTWTIRTQRMNGTRTEIDKLLDVDTTLLRPSYHIQAYTKADWVAPTGAACIRTVDLIRMLMAGDHWPTKRNPEDGTLFVPVSWRQARDLGYEVHII